jgi:phosphoribosylformylglycinamidine cyclo-ligase
VRKVFGNRLTTDKGLCETLLTPTKLYVKPILSLISELGFGAVKGIANITGGGFYENIPRCLPDGLCAKIDKASLEVPAIFCEIAEVGKIPENDMYSTFNMGVGMVVAVSAGDAISAMALLRQNGTESRVIGTVERGVHGAPSSVEIA